MTRITLMSMRSYFCWLGLTAAVLVACGDVPVTGTTTDTSTSESGDGDGDPGDGDGDPGDGDGDGDGDTGDGDGDGLFANGDTCSLDQECASGNCFVIPFLGGRCGECNEDVDCPDGGCTSFNPFGNDAPMCNLGQSGGGCESDAACQLGLSCVNIFDLLGLISVNTCSSCASDLDCQGLDICAPMFDLAAWQGSAQCIPPGSLPQDSSCSLDGNGDQACMSGICSVVDIMAIAEIGACGECNNNADCGGNELCNPGHFILNDGTLVGSFCQ
jgi:hypothetical protein